MMGWFPEPFTARCALVAATALSFAAAQLYVPGGTGGRCHCLACSLVDVLLAPFHLAAAPVVFVSTALRRGARWVLPFQSTGPPRRRVFLSEDEYQQEALLSTAREVAKLTAADEGLAPGSPLRSRLLTATTRLLQTLEDETVTIANSLCRAKGVGAGQAELHASADHATLLPGNIGKGGDGCGYDDDDVAWGRQLAAMEGEAAMEDRLAAAVDVAVAVAVTAATAEFDAKLQNLASDFAKQIKDGTGVPRHQAEAADHGTAVAPQLEQLDALDDEGGALQDTEADNAAPVSASADADAGAADTTQHRRRHGHDQEQEPAGPEAQVLEDSNSDAAAVTSEGQTMLGDHWGVPVEPHLFAVLLAGILSAALFGVCLPFISSLTNP